MTPNPSPDLAAPAQLWDHDRAYFQAGGTPGLVGVDEAGRGALAGPVMAAAVYLEKPFFESAEARAEAVTINDSKQLKATDRDLQHAIILQWKARGLIRCAWAPASVQEIEDYNILGATRLAMQRSLEALEVELPSLSEDMPLFKKTNNNQQLTTTIIVDGRPLKPFPYQHEGIVKGDGKSLCIAAASILAKVGRDRLMTELCKRHSGYGFSQHKGYGTPIHREALNTLGPCPEHRKLFLRKVLGNESTPHT